MLDLEPATLELTRVIDGLRHEQLCDPTPCANTSVAALLHHAAGFATAFTFAARKTTPEQQGPPPAADAAQLDPFWRVTTPKLLARLADAWRDSAAWSGQTGAGGVDLPGEVAGLFALDEVIVHAWDLAVASGQRVEFDEALLAPLHEFLAELAAESPTGTPGLFGPPVPVPAGAPLLDRVLGLTGRDPAWRPSAAADLTGSAER